MGEWEATTGEPSVLATPTVEYTRGPDMGGGVGGLLYSVRSSTAKFNLSNGRGDIVAQSDSTGALSWTASYEAYGKRTKETGVNEDKQRANSKDEDPTGLLNEGFRYRDLETGVFLSRDPAGFVDGPNLYAYVMQNPWSKFDPLGLSETWPWGGWVDYTGIGTYIHAVFDVGAICVGEPVAKVIGGTQTLVNNMDRKIENNRQLNSGQIDVLTHTQNNANLLNNSLEPAMEVATNMPSTTLTGPLALPTTKGSTALVNSSRFTSQTTEIITDRIASQGTFSNIIQGKIKGGEMQSIAGQLEKMTGTKIIWNSNEAKSGNFFDLGRNQIHLQGGVDKQRRGMFYEEVQHAMDYHADPNLITDPSKTNKQKHATTAERMIDNPLLPTSQEEKQSLKKLSDDWKK